MNHIAIVILNYNGGHFLKQFLPSVIAFSENAKIIVADNGSTDQSVEIVKTNFANVQVIEIGQNLGFCGGYNYALKLVTAEIFVLLNSDVEVTPHWLDPMADLFRNQLHVLAAQPKILSFHHRTQFEYAGAAGGFIDSLGYPFCRGRLFDQVEEDQGQYDDAQQVFWATGACLFIRSKTYFQMGGLDEDFFAHMEEIDLCWKINRAGGQVYCEPRSKVFHVGGGTLSKSNPRKTYLNFKNGLSLLMKHLAGTEIWWKLPMRMMLDWVALARFCLGGQIKDGKMIAKAHWDFLGELRRTYRKRKQIADLGYLKLGSPRMIVIDYFLLKRNRFTKLTVDRAKLIA